MPIFSRRVIQKILNKNRRFFPAGQVAEHVKKLNNQDNVSIATVWEVVILNALSKVGEVKHEKKFEGSRKPDIFFESSNITPFVADITAISDEYYDKENPINYFRECLNNFFNKEGLTTKGLSIDVGNEKVGNYGDRKIRLSLPEKKDISSFIKQEFFIIREAIKYAPNQAFKTEIKKENASFSIFYNPHSKYSAGGYASYTVPYSLTKNPIYNRLKKKADQLRNSKYDGVMGVFVCDGECDSLNNEFYCVEKFSQADIIQVVFRVNTSLSFVVILTPEEHHQVGTAKYLKGLFYPNPKAKFPVNQDFFQELKKIETYFPAPESMPVNVKTYLKSRKNKGLSHYGGFTVDQDEIKISSRMITELLAGVLEFEKFDTEHKQMSNENKNMIKEFFLNQLKEGRMIDNISIEKCHDEDDDWIKFKYGYSDAAISKYQ
jgi:hypothetical protein